MKVFLTLTCSGGRRKIFSLRETELVQWYITSEFRELNFCNQRKYFPAPSRNTLKCWTPVLTLRWTRMTEMSDIQTRTKDWGNGRKITKSLLLLVTYGHGFFKFIIQKAKGGFKMRCFYVIGARLWNDVNINLKVCIFLFRKEWSLKLFWRATNMNFPLLEGSVKTVKNVG